MSAKGLGNRLTINAFVEDKLKKFDGMPKNFRSLFSLMFSEKENVMYERSTGYKIEKKTYGEVYGEIIGRTVTLRRLLADVPSNSAVGLYLDNSLDWIELFWAILLAGYRPLLMNLRLSDELLSGALADCGAEAVIAEEKSFGKRLITPAEISAGEGTLTDDCGTELLVMSSGTTQNLKICAYTGEEIYWQIIGSIGIVRECPAIKKHYGNSLKLLTFLPFYHVFGLIAVYIWFSFFSRTFVQLNDMSPNTVTNTIKRHKVTHIFAVPLFWETVYAKALQTIRDRGGHTYEKFLRGAEIAEKLHDVPLLGSAFTRLAMKEVRDNMFGESVRFMITGGGSIGTPVLSFFNNVGYRLCNGYGMTEIGITSVELSTKKKYLYGGYVGKPISSAEYRINEDGELLVRGKATSAYVLCAGEKTVNDGWYNTRDLCEELNGHYRMLGRADDLIVTPGGENLNPAIIEPSFDFAGTNGVCLIKTGSAEDVKPVLLVSVDRYLGADAFAALSGRVNEKLAEMKSGTGIRTVYITDRLITGDEFKLNRRRLAADFAAGRLHVFGELAAEATDDPVELTVRGLFSAALGRDADRIPADSDFFTDEGGTSLAWYALCAEITEQFGLSVPAQNYGQCRTVRGMTGYVKEKKNDVDQIR